MPSSRNHHLSLHGALPIWSPRPGGSRARPGSRSLKRRTAIMSASRPSCATSRPRWPIRARSGRRRATNWRGSTSAPPRPASSSDRKSTRLNSSHGYISYAVIKEPSSFPTRRSSDLVAQTGGQQGETRLQILEAQNSYYERIATELRDVETALADSRPKWAAARDQLARIDIRAPATGVVVRSEEHTSELQSRLHLVCRHQGTIIFPYTALFRSGRPDRGAAGRDPAPDP